MKDIFRKILTINLNIKILDLFFIYFSKLYVKFSKREDDWFYLPLLIISFIFCFNLFIVSRLFIDFSPYYVVGLVFLIRTLRNNAKQQKLIAGIEKKSEE